MGMHIGENVATWHANMLCAIRASRMLFIFDATSPIRWFSFLISFSFPSVLSNWASYDLFVDFVTEQITLLISLHNNWFYDSLNWALGIISPGNTREFRDNSALGYIVKSNGAFAYISNHLYN